MIIDGELDHLPESNLKGTIEEAIEGRKMLAEVK
jgi:hypothetical protein